jgi:hypothetical protein
MHISSRFVVETFGITAGDTRFVEKPLQQREEKTTGASQGNFTISVTVSVYKRRELSYGVINPNLWLLQGV